MTIKFEIEATEDQAYSFAQFLKRVQFSDYRQRSEDTDEAYWMQEFGIKIQDNLADHGFAPR